MSQFVLYAMAIFGVLILLYYIFMIISGKRFARLVKTKDRFIWNGLKNISDPSMPYAKMNNTLFLDPGHLVISPISIVRMSRQIRRTGALEDALVIPYDRIVSFDFDSSLKDSNALLRLLAFLFNRLFKVNNYNLLLTFIDDRNELKEMKFRARNMDSRDFELSFADFDNRIYTGRKLTAHEREKGGHRPYSKMEENPTIPPETVGFSLDDEEISVLEQTIYLPEDTLDTERTIATNIPLDELDTERTIATNILFEESESSSEDTVVLHQPPVLETDSSLVRTPVQETDNIFSSNETKFKIDVSLTSDEALREKMREFAKNRK